MASNRVEAKHQRANAELLGGLEERLDFEGDDSDNEMADPTEYDREILSEGEEREKLLRKHSSYGELKRTDHRSRGVRKRKKRQDGEKAELIFEMEEGGLRDDSSSQSRSSSLEQEREKLNDGEGVRVGWPVVLHGD